MLSTKDLVFKEQLARKLVDQYVGPYIIDKIILTNAIKLRLPTTIRIHSVVNISWVVQYKKQVERQKAEEMKPVEVEAVKEWEVEKILKKKSKKNDKVLNTIEGVYSRT